MAGEIQVRSGFAIRKLDSTGTIILTDYQSRPSAFTADFNGSVGPTPGMITVGPGGSNVNLSALTTVGGWCFIQNCSGSETIEWGVYDLEGTTPGRFIPVGQLLPGESFNFRMSDLFGKEIGTGTGTAPTSDPTPIALRIRTKRRAISASANVKIEAFDY